MTVKTAAKRFGNGLLDCASAMHNAGIQNQINEIDDETKALRQQLTRLEEKRAELEARKI